MFIRRIVWGWCFGACVLGCSGGGPGVVEEQGGPATSASTSPPSSSSTATSKSFTGSWSGTFNSSRGGAGAAAMTLNVSGQTVTGSVDFDTSPCFAAAKIAGALEGDVLHATVEATDVYVTLQATIANDKMTGTYEVVKGGKCSSDTGSFSFTRAR